MADSYIVPLARGVFGPIVYVILVAGIVRFAGRPVGINYRLTVRPNPISLRDCITEAEEYATAVLLCVTVKECILLRRRNGCKGNLRCGSGNL